MNSELVRLTGDGGVLLGIGLNWAGLGWAMGSFWVTKALSDIGSTFGRGISHGHCQLTISVSASAVSGCPTLGYHTPLAWAAQGTPRSTPLGCEPADDDELCPGTPVD